MPKSNSGLPEKNGKSVFNISDQNLPTVCAFAALEFDWIIQGKKEVQEISKDKSSVEKLLALFSGLEETLKCRGYVDHKGLCGIALAHNSVTTNTRVEKLAGLLPVVSNLVSLLRNPHEAGKQDLVYMKAFLFRLSEEASKVREEIQQKRTRGL